MSAFKVTDNFNRADENPLAGSWSTGSGETAMKIVSNSATFTAAGSDASSYWNLETWSADQYSQAKLTVTGTTLDTGPGLVVRRSTSALTWYRVTVSKNATNVALWKAVAGTYTNIWQRTATFTDGDTVRLEVKGTTLRVFINGVQVGADATDTAISTGKPGIAYSSSSTAATVDDWEAGDLGAEPRFPYTSPLSFSGPYSVRLSSTWDFYLLDIPAADVAVNAESVSVTVTAYDATANIQPNADTTTAVVSAFDASVVGLEEQAGFKTGPSPIPFGLNVRTVSTWDFWVQNVDAPTTFANAEQTSVTVVANNDNVIVAANADHAAASVTSNSSTASLAPNAETTVASVVANADTANVQPNAGTTNAAVAVNDSTSSVAPNAGHAAVAVTSNAPTSSIAPNAGTTTATVVANNSTANVAANAGFVTVTVAGFDATPYGLEEQARFKNGPTPVPFGLNNLIQSTWNFWTLDSTIFGAATSANAELVSVSVIADNDNVIVAANAGLASVTVTANNSAINAQPNAGTTTATVTANDSTVNVQPNAGTTTATVVANSSTSSMAANAGLASVTTTANDSTASVQTNGGMTVAVVTATDTLAFGLEEQAGFKNGPTPVPFGLNTLTQSTWDFYSRPTELPVSSDVNVFAGTTTASITANNASVNDQPNAGTTSVSVASNDSGKTVAANAGFATVSVASLAVQANAMPSAGTTTAIVISNGSGKTVAANAGITTVTVTAYPATIPIDGMVSAGFATVIATVFAPVAVVGTTHDYSGGSGATEVSGHTGGPSTSKSGISGATEISNSSNTAMRVEGG